MEEAFEELKDQLDVLYNSNNRGILLQMLNGCRRCGVKEEECMKRIVQILKKVLGVEDDADYGVFLEKCLSIEKEGGRVSSCMYSYV